MCVLQGVHNMAALLEKAKSHKGRTMAALDLRYTVTLSQQCPNNWAAIPVEFCNIVLQDLFWDSPSPLPPTHPPVSHSEGCCITVIHGMKVNSCLMVVVGEGGGEEEGAMVLVAKI